MKLERVYEMRFIRARRYDLSDTRRRLRDVLRRCAFFDIPELQRLGRSLVRGARN